MKTTLAGLALGALVASAGGCALESYTFVDLAPSLEIVSPLDGMSVELTANGNGQPVLVPLQIRAQNFRLAPDAECGATEPRCGHVHINIGEGNVCQIALPGGGFAPYNGMGFGEDITADLSICSTMLRGLQPVVISLQRKNHAPVIVNREPVVARVNVMLP